MITAEDICERIANKLGSKASAVTLDADTTFESVGLSSLQIADIVYGIEDDFDIRFDESQAAAVKTVGDLVKLAEQAAADDSAA
ncbi:acyl carrier protein [Streptomyces armeniacus]|uniref:Acyl carrier protein n=1 Tax=Streptomyces armeniacus TaxID=83291 RepID=A0A345XXB9_9ACTN|nr:phosphopantetheine-binding protein [Streptomyces armeniacus]AXK36285.1 acyl carrier protein [Streptomyces armeniacus]